MGVRFASGTRCEFWSVPAAGSFNPSQPTGGNRNEVEMAEGKQASKAYHPSQSDGPRAAKGQNERAQWLPTALPRLVWSAAYGADTARTCMNFRVPAAVSRTVRVVASSVTMVRPAVLNDPAASSVLATTV